MREISFDDIIFANQSIKTTDIKGKEYAEVNQRIKAFRMLYPQGFITTDIISNEEGVVVMKATAGYYDDQGNAVVLGTGTAYERENSSFINKTSYIENCETSAIGRCLAIATGIGCDTSVASYEEVQNAIANQSNTEGVTIGQFEWEQLKKMYTREQIKEMYNELGITRGTDIPLSYFDKKQKEYEAKFSKDHPDQEYY